MFVISSTGEALRNVPVQKELPLPSQDTRSWLCLVHLAYAYPRNLTTAHLASVTLLSRAQISSVLHHLAKRSLITMQESRMGKDGGSYWLIDEDVQSIVLERLNQGTNDEAD